MYVTDLAKAMIFELFITLFTLHLIGSPLYVVPVVISTIDLLAYLKQVVLVVLKLLVVQSLGPNRSAHDFVVLDVAGAVLGVNTDLVHVKSGRF